VQPFRQIPAKESLSYYALCLFDWLDDWAVLSISAVLMHFSGRSGRPTIGQHA